MRFFALIACLLLAPFTASAEVLKLPTAKDIERSLLFASETTALTYLAKLCIANRKSYQTTTRALKANGYKRTMKNGSNSAWYGGTKKPMILVQRKGSALEGCMVMLEKPAHRLANLEQRLDELTKEDIMRVPPEILNGKKGEKAWLLSPGLKYLVGIGTLGDRNEHSALVLYQK